MKKEMLKGAIFGLIIALFMPHFVKAEVTYNNHGLSISQGIGTNLQPGIQINNSTFWGTVVHFNLQGNTVLNWKYNVSPGNYNISGLFFFSDGGSHSRIVPIILLNNVSCTINPGFATGGSEHEEGVSGWYSFYCSNVQLGTNNTLTLINTGGVGSYIGIWDGFNYYDTASQGTVDNVIKQQQETNQKLEESIKQQEQTNKELGDLNNNLTNSDTSDASSSANDFFSGFESDDFGLTAIITAPLNFIKSITSSTCTPIGFKAPFVDQQITLPCMDSIYKQYFGSFLTIYQTITFGIVAYWVCVNTLATVRGFKDPESDRIEVLDL